MTDQWTEAERDAYFAPGDTSNGDGPNDDYETPPGERDGSHSEHHTEPFSLFDAPDYATFVRHQQTARGKEYEDKVRSVLKAAALTCFRSNNPVDGATIVHYGPGVARKAGDLTDVSDGARKVIDILTAPDNPAALFALAAIPFVMQMFRNHEPEVEQVGQSWSEARKQRKARKARIKAGDETPPKRPGRPVTIHGPFSRKFTFYVRTPKPAILVNIFRSQTKDPVALATDVLSDPKLQRALAKQGIVVTVRQEPNA